MLWLVLAVVGMLVFLSALSTVMPMHPLTPNVVLPIVIFLGASQGVELIRGAAFSVVLGYLLDAFSGSALGMNMFLCVVTFYSIRGAGLRFILRGIPFQMATTFVIAILYGGSVLAIRATFIPRIAIGGTSLWDTLALIAPQAFTTMLISPLLFALVKRTRGLSSGSSEVTT